MDEVLRFFGGFFLVTVALIFFIVAYAWACNRWERIMNYRKAKDLQEENDDLRQCIDEKNAEIARLKGDVQRTSDLDYEELL